MSDTDSHQDIIRRRRLVAIMVLCAATAAAAFSDNLFQPIKWWTSDEGEYVAGDPLGAEWVYARCNDGEQQITVLRNDRLEGADALSSLALDVPDWCDLPRVDNPELDQWQADLDLLRAATGSGASGPVVLKAALAMPVSSLALKPVIEWMQQGSLNSTAFLDALSDDAPSLSYATSGRTQTARTNLTTMVNEAIARVDVDQLGSLQLQSWLESDVIARTGESAATLYRSVAARLVPEDRHGAMLARQLGELPANQRIGVLRELLMQPQVSATFTRELLLGIDDIFYGQAVELEAFTAIADRIAEEPDAHQVLSAALENLPDRERRMAAIHLVRSDTTEDARFTIGVLQEFDELHASSQPLVIEAIVRSPQFSRLEVQLACLDAIEQEMSGSRRNEALAEMLLRQTLQESLKSRIMASAS